MVRKIVLIGLLASSVIVTACNTVRGVGRDLESVGGAVSRTAD